MGCRRPHCSLAAAGALLLSLAGACEGSVTSLPRDARGDAPAPVDGGLDGWVPDASLADSGMDAGALDASGRDGGRLPPTDAGPSPRYPAATWLHVAPGEVSLSRGDLDALAAYVGGRAVVVRDGVIAYGWGDESRRGDVASAAKVFYSHFLFVAVQEGLLGSVDDLVVDVEPRLAGLNAGLGYPERELRWRHLANQTSCYGVSERPGAAFDYNDWQMALFWDSLFVGVYGATYATVDAEVFARRLCDTLQCEDSPTFMAFGPSDRAGRVAISVRDFARFGLLYLHEGEWRGAPLVPRAEARMAVTSSLPNSIPRTTAVRAEMIPGQRSIGSTTLPDDQTDHLGSYSWLWWTNGVDRSGRRHWPDAPTDTYGAFGHGGPRAMIVIPSLDLILSWNDASVRGRDAENEALRRLVAAVM